MNKPTYQDSEGNRYTTDQIDAKSKKTALRKLTDQLVDYGYNFCEECKRNDCKPIDVSHNVSRKKAKENGNVEIIWDPENMEILGRKCHQIKDGLV